MYVELYERFVRINRYHSACIHVQLYSSTYYLCYIYIYSAYIRFVNVRTNSKQNALESATINKPIYS